MKQQYFNYILERLDTMIIVFVICFVSPLVVKSLKKEEVSVKTVFKHLFNCLLLIPVFLVIQSLTFLAENFIPTKYEIPIAACVAILGVVIVYFTFFPKSTREASKRLKKMNQQNDEDIS